MDLFSFVSPDALPNVESGYIVKHAPEMTEIVTVVNGAKISNMIKGPMDSDVMTRFVSTINQNVKEEDLAVTVDEHSKIDEMIIARANSFSPESGLPMAGNPQGEHWVMYAWNIHDFWGQGLTDEQTEFLTENTAVIAHKVLPDVEPELDYFKDSAMAIDRMNVLTEEYGAP